MLRRRSSLRLISARPGDGEEDLEEAFGDGLAAFLFFGIGQYDETGFKYFAVTEKEKEKKKKEWLSR